MSEDADFNELMANIETVQFRDFKRIDPDTAAR